MELTRLPPPAPISGWWLDGPGDSVTLFHGSDALKIESIASNGLLLHSDRCFLTPCYQTATNYTIFGPAGGDFSVMKGKAPLYLYPLWRYAVAHFHISKDFIEEHGTFHEPGTGPLTRLKRKLSARSIYDQSGEPDHLYYLWSEIVFRVPVPPEYFSGYSLPYCQ